MRTLIVYATKSGAARECAIRLGKRVGDCSVYDLDIEMPSPEAFDRIIIGSGIRMGRIYKQARKFMQVNLDQLLSKRVSVFLCSAYPDTLEKSINKSIPDSLKASALQIKSLGGKPPFSGSISSQAWLNEVAIEEFVDALDNS